MLKEKQMQKNTYIGDEKDTFFSGAMDQGHNKDTIRDSTNGRIILINNGVIQPHIKEERYIQLTDFESICNQLDNIDYSSIFPKLNEEKHELEIK